MDVRNVEQMLRRQLGGMYVHAQWYHGAHPKDAPLQKQKKLVGWMRKLYKDEIAAFPPEIREMFSETADPQALFKLLWECEEYIAAALRERKANALDGLRDELRPAFAALIHDSRDRILCCQGQQIRLILEGWAYRQTVTLVDPRFESIPEGSYSVWDMLLSREEETGTFYLTGETSDLEDLTFGIRFRDAHVTTEVFSAMDSGSPTGSAWDILEQIADGILTKRDHDETLCNSAELELLPVLRELSALHYYQEANRNFPRFRALAQKHGYEKLTQMLAALETESRPKWRIRLHGILRTEMMLAKYEPLWRELYAQISNSQASYPRKAEQLPGTDAAREVIQRQLHELGFEGTYPEFYKTGSVKKLRLANAFGQTYFVGGEKRAVFFVRCLEDAFSDGLNISLLSGTALLKKGETVEDAFSCCFDGKGRRYFRLLPAGHYPPIKDGDYPARARAAAKAAQMESLSKQERDLFGRKPPGWAVYLSWLILGGGLFSILFHALFIPAILLLVWIIGGWSSAMELLRDPIWLKTFLFGWIGFGGAMGLLTVWSLRK